MSDAEMSRFTRPRKLGERETIRSLLPYLWPRNEMELRVRVVAAIRPERLVFGTSGADEESAPGVLEAQLALLESATNE